MRQIIKCAILCLGGLLVLSTAYANEENIEQNPWEKVAFSFGGFIANTNTSFRLGADAGVDIDVEELLGLESTNTVFRFDGLWRFTENRKHRMNLSWFSLRRSGEKTIGQDIEILQKDGEDFTTISDGSKVESYFNLDIYQLAYSYSFLQDDRIDVAAQLGLHVMPIEFGLKATGFVDEEGEAKFTAPLPTVGFRMDIALTPKWFVRTGIQIFYLEYQQFKGSILASQGAIEYVPWKHFGIGIGVDSFQIRAEAKGEDYPRVDLNGSMEFSYVGLQLYGRVFF